MQLVLELTKDEETDKISVAVVSPEFTPAAVNDAVPQPDVIGLDNTANTKFGSTKLIVPPRLLSNGVFKVNA